MCLRTTLRESILTVTQGVAHLAHLARSLCAVGRTYPAHTHTCPGNMPHETFFVNSVSSQNPWLTHICAISCHFMPFHGQVNISEPLCVDLRRQTKGP